MFTPCTSDLFCPYCSSSATDAVITERPPEPTRISRAVSWPAQAVSACGSEQVCSGAFHRPDLTVHELQNLLMLPVSALFTSFYVCTQCFYLETVCMVTFLSLSGLQRSAGVAVTCAAVTWVHLAISSLSGASYWFTINALPKGSSLNCSAPRRGS